MTSQAGDGSWDETLFVKSFDKQLKMLSKESGGGDSLGAGERLTKDDESTIVDKKNEQKTRKKKKKTDKELWSASEKPTLKLRNHSTVFKYVDQEHQAPKVDVAKPEIFHKKQVPEQNAKLIPPAICSSSFPKIANLDEAQASMLMSWYMAGYHTGYYEAMKRCGGDQDSEIVCDNVAL